MFRIKICGITNLADAVMAAEAGADAIGLNFYPQSKRYVSPDNAQQICQALEEQFGDAVARVGVFVNTPVDQLQTIAEQVGLTAVQLHGDEPPQMVAELGQLPVVRARQIEGDDFLPILQDLADCQSAGRRPDAVLVDAAAAGQYGGTGETVAWDVVARHRHQLADTPLLLAGGLTPENVAQAIRAAHPDGVDVASGVESSPGHKEQAKVSLFVAQALNALK